MKLRYDGPHDAVEVLVDGETVVVEQGKSAEFTGDTAENLLAQKTWSRLHPPKSETKSTAKSSEEGSK